MVFALIALGCWSIPLEVQLTGTLLDERKGQGLAEADIEVFDANGVAFGTGTTGSGGAIDVTVPAAQSFFVTFDHADAVPTSFTGIAGSSDVEAEDGTLFMRTPADLDTLRAEFAACPDVDVDGPVVEGEVRFYLPVEGTAEDLPTFGGARVTVYDLDDTPYTACYQDDDGNSLPDGEGTGTGGRFAVFGVPTGPLVVGVEWDFTEQTPLTSWYLVSAPDGGVVPMYPAWIESP